MAAWTRDQLSNDRITWLSQLSIMHIQEDQFALVHAGPTNPWRVQLDALSHHPLVVHGHTHKPGIVGKLINSGSVGQPHDGDPRASYLLLDNAAPQIRRVKYEREKEIKALKNSGIPHANWIASIIKTAMAQMPHLIPGMNRARKLRPLRRLHFFSEHSRSRPNKIFQIERVDLITLVLQCALENYALICL